MREDRLVDLARARTEGIRERGHRETIGAHHLDRGHDVVVDVRREPMILDVLGTAQVKDAVRFDGVTIGRELAKLRVLLLAESRIATDEERDPRTDREELRSQRVPRIDGRIVERQREPGPRPAARGEVCIGHEREAAVVRAFEHMLDHADRNRRAGAVRVELGHLAARDRTIERAIDARERVVRVIIEVDRAMHRATVAVVEHAVDLGEVLLAARDHCRQQQGTCYRRDVRTLVLATVLAAVTVAHAEPRDLVTRPLVLEAGAIDARLTTEINLQKNRYGRPLSLAPDLWYGVTSRWTVGLIHSNPSVDRIDAGATFCLRRFQTRCDRLYRGSGIDVRWSWLTGPLAIAPRARLLLRDVDPMKPAITAGALVRWTRGRFAVESDPYLRLGLANRDLGNRAAVFVPVLLAVQPTCRWLLAIHTGWDSEVAVASDGYHIPFGLVVRARATPHVDVAVEAGFTSLLGPQNNIKQRAALVTVGWRTN
ncbi:MAG: hypothetical protein JWP01_3750 [Myxococcales bacterium]|nr:hypothetical protein [Myxococcales bacterium]